MIWNGNVAEALDRLHDLLQDLDLIRTHSAAAEKLAFGMTEFEIYIRNRTTEMVPGRGCAIGDFDNDGNLDALVNCVNAVPQLLPCESTLNNNWPKVKAVGAKSNRSGIGARIFCRPEGQHRQMDEVRSAGSYISQSDLRVHFGLAKADVEVHWQSGVVDKLAGVKANQVGTVVEGKHLP